MPDSTLGSFRTFAAMDLKAAGHRRRRAAELTGHDKPMRRRLLDNARFLIHEARYCRLKREAAMIADRYAAEAEAFDAAGEPLLANLARNEARKAEHRSMTIPHPHWN